MIEVYKSKARNFPSFKFVYMHDGEIYHAISIKSGPLAKWTFMTGNVIEAEEYKGNFPEEVKRLVFEGIFRRVRWEKDI